MKSIILYSKACPDVGGFPDKLAVINKDELVWHGQCSACPNPTKPWVKGNAHWSVSYGWLSPGKYDYQVVDHHKYKKCVLLCDGGPLPTRYPNPNKQSEFYGKLFMSEVFCHKAWSSTWRGSAGCPTLAPKEWGHFIKLFEVGDSGFFSILDWSHSPRIAKKCKKSFYCQLFEKAEA